MIAISKTEMDLIRDRRIRKRTLELPVRLDSMAPARHPRTGRVLASAATSGTSGQTYTQRCPLREGGTYTLVERQPHGQWRTSAANEPTRARGVLWWIACCEGSPKTLKITVLATQRIGDAWIVRFAIDNHGDVKDHVDTGSVFLARAAGYTTAWDEIRAGEVLTPLQDDLRAARREAREGRAVPQREALDKLSNEIKTCRQVMSGMKQRKRLELALKEVERAQAELAAETPDSVIDQSVCAARQAPVEPKDEPRPSGTQLVVHLHEAA